MPQQPTLSTARLRRPGTSGALRGPSRRAASVAVAVVAAAVLALGGVGVVRVMQRSGLVPSATRELAEAAEKRAQYESGLRLLERVGATTATPTPAKAKAPPPVTPPAATPAPPLAVAAVPQPPPLPVAPAPVVPAPAVKTAVVVPIPPPATATPATPTPADVAPRPTTPAVTPAVPPPQVALALKPFDPMLFARFRATERDLTLAAVPPPQPPVLQAPDRPAPVVVVPPAPPVAVALPPTAPPSQPAATPNPSPTFGSVDPVPQAAEAARKAGRQGVVSCAAINEQAQVGELSAEDRDILKQRRCR